MTQHGIELGQGFHACQNLGFRNFLFAGLLKVGDESGQFIVVMWQEFMQRRIQESDGDFLACHRPENPVKIIPLDRPELFQRDSSFLSRIGKYHLAENIDPVFSKEHMFRAAQANSFGSKGKSQS